MRRVGGGYRRAAGGLMSHTENFRAANSGCLQRSFSGVENRERLQTQVLANSYKEPYNCAEQEMCMYAALTQE